MQLLSRRGARSQVQFCPGSDSDSALFYCCHTTASAAATATATSASSSASLTLAACSSVRFSSVLVRLFGFRSHSGSNARLAWLVFYLIQTYVCALSIVVFPLCSKYAALCIYVSESCTCNAAFVYVSLAMRARSLTLFRLAFACCSEFH